MAKAKCADQSAINLISKILSSACKSLLSKGYNFVPTPYDINWYILKYDFDNFVNKLRFYYLSATPAVTDTTCNNEQELYEPPS